MKVIALKWRRNVDLERKVSDGSIGVKRLREASTTVGARAMVKATRSFGASLRSGLR